MNDLQLDSNHDLVISDKDFVLLNSNPEVTKQALLISLRTWRGEWWLNTQIGVPYLQDLLKKGVSKTFIDTVIKDAIRNGYNIQSLDSFKSIITDRHYIVTDFKGTTEDGDIVSITSTVII